MSKKLEEYSVEELDDLPIEFDETTGDFLYGDGREEILRRAKLAEQMQKELMEASKVYCEITNGLLSNTHYDSSTIITQYEDNLSRIVDEAIAEQQPKWKLTQILLELERAGLPEPERIENFAYAGNLGFIYKDREIVLSFENEKNYNSAIIYCDRDDKLGQRTLPEAIQKLKELLKQE